MRDYAKEAVVPCGKSNKSLLFLENGLLPGGLYALLRRRLKLSVLPRGAVKSRHPDDLNQGILASDDAAHPSDSRHYFEWWYFDAQFTDGHTFVGTVMCPYKSWGRRQEPEVYLHINTPGGEQCDVRSSHPHTALRASTETCDVSCAGSSVQGSYPEWKVDLAEGGLSANLEFRNMVPGWMRGTGETVFGSYHLPAVFGWAVPQPRAHVRGSITYNGRTHEVEGGGLPRPQLG